MPVLIKQFIRSFELAIFQSLGPFERAQVQMPISPGSGFDARELLGLFLNVIERR